MASKFLNIWAVDLDGPHVYFGTANREIFRRDFTSDELDVATGVEAAAYAVSSTEIRAIVPHVASSTFANVVAVHNPDGRCTGAYFAIE